MSDNIPFEIQLEIIKKVPDVKSLVRFRAVSKPWKSLIDSSEFITGYGARKTQPQSLLLRYTDNVDPPEVKCLSFVDDDDTDIFTQQQDLAPNVTDLMKKFDDLKVIGSSHGLLCFYSRKKRMFLLWNPSLKKSVGIALPDTKKGCLPIIKRYFGFMVCPVTSDPIIVDFSYRGQVPIEVHIFTLSSKRWNLTLCSNLPHVQMELVSSQVVIGSCIYWQAGEFILNNIYLMILSFDLIAKEFRVVHIPPSVCDTRNFSCFSVFISKQRESLVLFVPNSEIGVPGCGVWKMEHDESFTNLFTISTPGYTIYNVLGFRKNGELVMQTKKEDEEFTALEFYEPRKEHINNLGISGEIGSFFMDCYEETLLLLNHSDGCVYSDRN